MKLKIADLTPEELRDILKRSDRGEVQGVPF
jgi:hypothetical protein